MRSSMVDAGPNLSRAARLSALGTLATTFEKHIDWVL